MASEATQAYQLHNMVGGPAASAVVKVIFRTEDGIMVCYGTAADTVLEAEAANTYAPGCLYIKVVSGGSSILYINEGAADSVADFVDVTA
jgi:hypothetical protein